mmetsp:Transcript_6553/g.8516  ORF Transcript_6553/g.8516 Transcript_6553/m.8516 type:complete len:125 (+) Transcript_6553:63-437(+)|eukprot:CAMPEP_0198136572 /NCGR_PEP_ID=MMETSP1443-20131203/217_1 /TAXON_ID=186043 /ORGANISM="Entomoneis sp., Strain CCMP2396" /LENGTH=124 /DNA_ID=CAMNT_0043797819 /DNA_START=176 /DNA_END=550 /DNA_ORIENTATION=-
MTESKDDPVNAIIAQAKPIIAKLGFGTVVGYCSGMAMKKIGKAVAFVIGMGFIVVQGAVSAGYIAVDWNKVQSDVVSTVDTNNDGKLDEEDVKAYWANVKKVLINGIPDAGGFSLGFLWGVKYS